MASFSLEDNEYTRAMWNENKFVAYVSDCFLHIFSAYIVVYLGVLWSTLVLVLKQDSHIVLVLLLVLNILVWTYDEIRYNVNDRMILRA